MRLYTTDQFMVLKICSQEKSMIDESIQPQNRKSENLSCYN
jgi:hypothetical protein